MTKKVFISYARDDNGDKKLVTKFIKGLESYLPSSIEVVWDEHLEPGNKFELDIKNKIEKSNAALLLVSPNFAKSQFITQKELIWIFNIKKRKPYFKIIPVQLRLGGTVESLETLHFFTAKLEGRKDNGRMPYAEIEESIGLSDKYFKDLAELIQSQLADSSITPSPTIHQKSASSGCGSLVALALFVFLIWYIYQNGCTFKCTQDPFVYEYSEVASYYDNKIRILKQTRDDGPYLVTFKDGPDYSVWTYSSFSGDDYESDVAPISIINDSGERDCCFSIINTKGEIIARDSNGIYSSIGTFHGGLAAAYEQNGIDKGYITADFEYASDLFLPKYKKLGPFKNGQAECLNEDNLKVIIDQSGSIIE